MTTKEEIIYQFESRLLEICPEVKIRPSVVKHMGKDSQSEWSRQIIVPDNKSPEEYLGKIFGISNSCWGERYKQAISGSGKEDGKILTLHSSSLLALLCFSNVSKDTPLSIGGIEYTKVWFEVKNKVFKEPSNIDIVLENEDSNDLMFIESKYTEYLTPQNSAFSKEYFEFYKNILPMIKGYPLQMVYPRQHKKEDGMGLRPKSKEKLYSHLYMDGIKQCFSHLIGLCQGPADNPCFKWEGNEGNGRLRFATILYRFEGDAFKAYKKFYKETIGSINADILKRAIESIPKIKNNYSDRIEILPDILTYQDVFKDFSLPQNVKPYYKL
ncbi:MAG: hypothetical protein NC324_01070 [Bacteroides sp.]|nr:hypothetical protein [Bacteroides sp.]